MQGFCPSSTTCKTFAVVLGGFGTPMASKVDVAAFADLAAYLQPLCGLPACLAADGAHSPIYSWFWDGWSADSAGKPGFRDAAPYHACSAFDCRGR